MNTLYLHHLTVQKDKFGQKESFPVDIQCTIFFKMSIACGKIHFQI